MTSMAKWAYGAVGLGVASAAAHTFAGYRAKLSGAEHLSSKEQCVVEACADAFFPPGGEIPISGAKAELVAYMDRYVGRLPSAPRILTKLLFQSIEHSPWIFGPRRVRFSKLTLDERIAVLDQMRQSSIYFRRISFLSARTMLTMGYMAHPEVTRAMRLDQDPTPFPAVAPEAA